MRVRSSLLGALAALLLAGVPARAANHDVVATFRVFTPADVTITQGDSVTWRNGDSSPHNVRFDDGSFEQPAAPDSSAWSVSRTFDTVGTFRYYCEAHGLPGGIDMAGAVYVQPAPPPGTSGQPVSADRTAPALKLSGKRRQRVLRERVLLVRAEVSEASLVKARAFVSLPGKRKSLRAKTVSRQFAAGSASELKLKLSKRTAAAFRRALRKHSRLTARITVTAKDRAGNTATAKRRIVFKT